MNSKLKLQDKFVENINSYSTSYFNIQFKEQIMRKLIVFEFISLDGFMAGTLGCEMDFVLAGFNEEMEQDLAEQYQSIDSFIMGKTTFQNLGSYWPTNAARNEPLYNIMNSKEKLVCSTTLNSTEWSNSRIIKSDITTEIKHLKQKPGRDLMVIGSAAVVQSLLDKNLIDEFRFYTFPTVLTKGKYLFGANASLMNLKLLNTKVFTSGVIRVDYATY